MKKFFKEFKTFISRGNVIDLAVAVIIGAAFGKITTSLVNDIVMPLIGLAIGGLSVSDWQIELAPERIVNGETVAGVYLKFGSFIQSIIDFLLIALIIFLMLKAFNSLNKGLSEIADPFHPLTKAQVKELKKQGKKIREIQAIAEKTLEEQKQKELEAKQNTPPPVTTESLLEEIRDLLKQRESESK